VDWTEMGAEGSMKRVTRLVLPTPWAPRMTILASRAEGWGLNWAGAGVWTGALREEVTAVVRVVVIAGRGACRGMAGVGDGGRANPGGRRCSGAEV